MAPFVNTNSVDPKGAGQNLGKSANYDGGSEPRPTLSAHRRGRRLSCPGGKAMEARSISRTGRGSGLRPAENLLAKTNVVTRSGASEPAIGGFKTDDGERVTAPTLTSRHGGLRQRPHRRPNAQRLLREYHKAIGRSSGNNGLCSPVVASPGRKRSRLLGGRQRAKFRRQRFAKRDRRRTVRRDERLAIWGHDIGGYQDTNFSLSPPNLFMRWTQFGCFSPIMQMHRQVG